MGAGGWVHGWLMVDGQMGWWMDGGMAGGLDGDGWGMGGGWMDRRMDAAEKAVGQRQKQGPHTRTFSHFPPSLLSLGCPSLSHSHFQEHCIILWGPYCSPCFSCAAVAHGSCPHMWPVLCISPCRSAGDTEAPLHRLVGRGRQRRGRRGGLKGSGPGLAPHPDSCRSQLPHAVLRPPEPSFCSKPAGSPSVRWSPVAASHHQQFHSPRQSCRPQHVPCPRLALSRRWHLPPIPLCHFAGFLGRHQEQGLVSLLPCLGSWGSWDLKGPWCFSSDLGQLRALLTGPFRQGWRVGGWGDCMKGAQASQEARGSAGHQSHPIPATPWTTGLGLQAPWGCRQ